MTQLNPQTLDQILETRRIIVVCGTGGVGKTTISAALALSAAQSGRRVLVMTIDPARRLADSLGVTSGLNEATEIDVAGLLGEALPPDGSLHAMMLDAKATFDDMVRRFAPSPETRDRILANRYYQRASRSLSGSQEYMAMEKLLEMVSEPAYDLIVLDTPPSRNALEFLDAPRRMVSMLSDGGLRWLRSSPDGSFSAVRAGQALFGKAKRAMFGVFERFVGTEVLHGIAEFVSAFSSLLDGMKGRASNVMTVLKGDQSLFVMVCSPNRIALSEALFFHDRLIEAEMPFGGFVINRIRGRTTSEVDLPTDPSKVWPDGSDDPDRRACIEKVWANHKRRRRWAAVDRHHIAALAEHCGPKSFYVEVPELEQEVHDLEALSCLLPYLVPDCGDAADDALSKGEGGPTTVTQS